MNKAEIISMLILLVSWIAGAGVYYLYLLNNDAETKFKNVKSAFFLASAFGIAGAFIGAKANISFWLVWVAYAVAGGIVTNQMLKRADKPIPGVYGKGISVQDKEDVWTGIKNTFGMLAAFVIIALIGTSKFSWMLTFVPALFMGGLGWLYTKNLKGAARWAALGLIGGNAWYFTS